MKYNKGASYKLLTHIHSPDFQLHISTPLVFEYESILKREIEHSRHADMDAIVDYLCLIATAHQIFYLWRPVLHDIKDDHVLELAVKAQATIVTWNIKDFKIAKSKFGINVITPKELLNQKGLLS
ncbi:putative toxin-antitoxin system toxin component, PIN family [Methylotenera sp.]|jgi:predicted nucleic acid-binding protein|uniref:PIN domain-containing protein n=1 Tax=Methylotenera sp. TaxID=2051956 RepID=UPI002716EAEA|nr:PIN domain-containing protein [Methylotenera sp.]MDO9205936.1 PIN domain-containing protein [Methylotenera sp.]MDO9205939.1 PIN domain-containing protein [Methylotenera sp.]MDO9394173.1 PIN domain-containing protein [Methylotenera sp.]MDP2071961.1 PIN domain-containing protein [Methylotenera sp.]MDP3007030.1 PIN domain-containing protein [Methylotenera sp.]